MIKDLKDQKEWDGKSWKKSGKEDTSLSFRLAIWKTSDLIDISRKYMGKHWGAGFVYKMSRGTAKISKQVFWIDKDGDDYTFDNNREEIDNGKMHFFKNFKKKANYTFSNLFHTIVTFEKTFEGKLKFEMEKLSPEDSQFKIDLFQKKIKGEIHADGKISASPHALLSDEAHTYNKCKRD